MVRNPARDLDGTSRRGRHPRQGDFALAPGHFLRHGRHGLVGSQSRIARRHRCGHRARSGVCLPRRPPRQGARHDRSRGGWTPAGAPGDWPHRSRLERARGRRPGTAARHRRPSIRAGSRSLRPRLARQLDGSRRHVDRPIDSDRVASLGFVSRRHRRQTGGDRRSRSASRMARRVCHRGIARHGRYNRARTIPEVGRGRYFRDPARGATGRDRHHAAHLAAHRLAVDRRGRSSLVADPDGARDRALVRVRAPYVCRVRSGRDGPACARSLFGHAGTGLQGNLVIGRTDSSPE